MIGPITKEKEEEFKRQWKELAEKEKKISSANPLINVVEKRKCTLCGKFSLDSEDDIYLEKFEICYKCYLNNDWKIGR